MIVGYRCAVCRATLEIDTVQPWRCPNASDDDPHHVLHLVEDAMVGDELDSFNPFVRFAPRMAWWAFAEHHGMSEHDRLAIVAEVADDFGITPFERSQQLSEAIGVSIWVKDETGNLAGSHKVRHLVGILLQLVAAERLGVLADRPRLAIASCGNAAIAAATLADRVGWPLDVYVPTWMSDAVGDVLTRHGATIHRCERRPSDVPGDPAMLRFREAVSAGSIPFTVQGPENALALDAGRTLGWELGEAIAGAPTPGHDWRAVVQVGGGALAACVGFGLGPGLRLDTVQAEGCAPLADTWERIAAIDHPERYWAQVMRPWPNPTSAADGILDDETYDWIADVAVMVESGGTPIVAAEAEIRAANRIAREAGFDVSATGSAGLAGVLSTRHTLNVDDQVIVIMSGVAR